MHDPTDNEARARAILDARGVTRREMLRSLAGAGAALPFATSGALDLQQAAPRNLRFVPWRENRPILQPADLNFLGFIRFAPQPGKLWFTTAGFTSRVVNGELRFFISGDSDADRPILEYALPDAAPDPDLTRAPVAPFRKNWGPVYSGLLLTGSRAGGTPGGLHWDEERQTLWWTYGDSYVPTQHHPTVGATLFRSDGTTTSYGPWRTQWNSQRTRGALTALPEDFATAFTGGARIAVMAPQESGNVTSPFGASLSALDLPDPFRTAADVLTNRDWKIGNKGLILHDIDHRQARDTRYRNCGWRVLYDCNLGGSMSDGIPEFGGRSTGVGENDTMTTCVWVDLPDKHGVLYFGQLVTTPEGYKAPGDPDGFVHMWYGDPGRTDGWPLRTCCHFQDDPWWPATGPGAHYRVPMGWIYNPADFVATAQGSAALWSRTPTATFQWRRYVPQLRDRYPSFIWGQGAAFDKASRRIYVLLRKHDSITAPGNSRAVILVFQVR